MGRQRNKKKSGQIKLAEYFLEIAEKEVKEDDLEGRFESYENAAHIFERAKFWNRAAATYARLAKLQEKKNYDCALTFKDAARCIQEGNSKGWIMAAISHLNSAVNNMEDEGYDYAGDSNMELAALCLMVGKIDDAIKNCEAAAKCYRGDCIIHVNMCMAKAAHIAAVNGMYDKATDVYELMAHQSFEDKMQKYGVQNYLLNAAVCQLGQGGTITFSDALKKYKALYPSISTSWEFKILDDIAESIVGNNVVKFNGVFNQYKEGIFPVKDWKLDILNAVKYKMEGSKEFPVKELAEDELIGINSTSLMKLVTFHPITEEVIVLDVANRHQPYLEVLKVTISSKNMSHLYGNISVYIGEIYKKKPDIMIYNRYRSNPESMSTDHYPITLVGPKSSFCTKWGFLFDFNLMVRGPNRQCRNIEAIKGKFVDTYHNYDTPLTGVITGVLGEAKIEYILVREAIYARVELALINGDGEHHQNDPIHGKVTAWTSKFNQHKIVLFDTYNSDPVSLSQGELDYLVPLSRSFVVVPSGSKLTVEACLEKSSHTSPQTVVTCAFLIRPPGGFISEHDLCCGYGRFRVTITWV